MPPQRMCSKCSIAFASIPFHSFPLLPQVKLGGLGIMKHLPGGSARTRMERKKGYLDPEYFKNFSVTDKSDVYR